MLSKAGGVCRIDPGREMKVTSKGKRVKVKKLKEGGVEFETKAGEEYLFTL